MKSTLAARTTLSTLQDSTELLRNETLDGKTYLVAPVICLVEGVHNNEYISFEEISVFPEAWDGRPLPIDHPQDDNGQAITANSPKVIQASVVGFLFNVEKRKDIRGISGEIWIDIEKAATVPGGDEVLAKLNGGLPLEVSTAYFTFVDNTPGEFKNPKGGVEKFKSSQMSIRPDHLALLPFDVGACNWADGCGSPRINTDRSEINNDHTLVSEDDTTEKVDNTQTETMPTEKKTEKQTAPTVNGKQLGRALQAAIAANSGENGDTTQIINRLAVAANIDVAKVNSILAGELDFAPRSWLAIFAAVLDVDGWDIFMAAGNDNADKSHAENTSDDANSNETAQKAVTIPNNKEHSETETAVQSVKDGKPCGPCDKTLTAKVQEVVTNTLKSFGLRWNAEQEKQEMNKKEKVDSLIASDQTQFSENNREWLMTMSEDQLEVLAPAVKAETKEAEVTAANAKTEAEAKVEAKTEVKAAPVATTEAAKTVALSKADVLAALGIDESAFELVKANADDKKSARNSKIEKILKIEGCEYEKAELETFSDKTLDKTLALLQPEQPFYGGRAKGTAARQNDDDNTIPAPPAVLLAPPGVRGVDYAVNAAKGGK